MYIIVFRMIFGISLSEKLRMYHDCLFSFTIHFAAIIFNPVKDKLKK